MDQLLTRHQVEKKLQLTTSTIYRLMRAGQLPEPIKLGNKVVRWHAGELDEWLRNSPRASGEAA